jgi:hypothetical protein
MLWENRGGMNLVLDIGDGSKGYISYNPTAIAADDIETALVLIKGDDIKYLILNGDYRNEYEAAIAKDGIGGALRFYQSQPKERRSQWSSDVMFGFADEK